MLANVFVVLQLSLDVFTKVNKLRRVWKHAFSKKSKPKLLLCVSLLPSHLKPSLVVKIVYSKF